MEIKDLRYEAREKWEPFFAWYPIRFGKKEIWLERLERRLAGWGGIGIYYEEQWEYRNPRTGEISTWMDR